MKISSGILLLTCVLLLYTFFNLNNEGTLTGTIIALVTHPQDWQNSIFSQSIGTYLKLITAVSAGIFAAIYRPDMVAAGPLAILFTSYLFDFLSIYTQLAATTNVAIALLLLGPFAIVYMITVFDWWRGVNWS